MKKVLEEVGKSLMAFANIVTALVFVKSYFDNSDDNMLIYGIYFFIDTYILSSILIKLSERMKNE
ncbi:hypothetical protein [Sulfurimonas sp.]|uniref:hypothetical protein n=1 Tax=Sulfurimonas sp. TaxID=2022749 RepID=UPI0026043D50|nr:hypothetical protein [Sulfurimonas sp.]